MDPVNARPSSRYGCNHGLEIEVDETGRILPSREIKQSNSAQQATNWTGLADLGLAGILGGGNEQDNGNSVVLLT